MAVVDYCPGHFGDVSGVYIYHPGMSFGPVVCSSSVTIMVMGGIMSMDRIRLLMWVS